MKEGLIKGASRAAILTVALSACTPSSTTEQINDLDTKVGQIATQQDSMQQSIDALATTTLPATTIPDTTVPETTTTTEVPKLNLYALFAQDIVTGLPEENPDQIEAELRYLESELPSNLPFVATEDNSGVIFHPATGVVIKFDEPAHTNADEGGAAYVSWGHGTASFDGKTYEFPYQEGNVYLTFIIGKPDDSTIEDLNTTVDLTDYSSAHVYTNQYNPRQGETFPQRRLISKEKFVQDLWYALFSGSNHGVGAKTATVDFIDSYTGSQSRFVIVGEQSQDGSIKVVWTEIPMSS